MRIGLTRRNVTLSSLETAPAQTSTDDAASMASSSLNSFISGSISSTNDSSTPTFSLKHKRKVGFKGFHSLWRTAKGHHRASSNCSTAETKSAGCSPQAKAIISSTESLVTTVPMDNVIETKVEETKNTTPENVSISSVVQVDDVVSSVNPFGKQDMETSISNSSPDVIKHKIKKTSAVKKEESSVGTTKESTARKKTQGSAKVPSSKKRSNAHTTKEATKNKGHVSSRVSSPTASPTRLRKPSESKNAPTGESKGSPKRKHSRVSAIGSKTTKTDKTARAVQTPKASDSAVGNDLVPSSKKGRGVTNRKTNQTNIAVEKVKAPTNKERDVKTRKSAPTNVTIENVTVPILHNMKNTVGVPISSGVTPITSNMAPNASCQVDTIPDKQNTTVTLSLASADERKKSRPRPLPPKVVPNCSNLSSHSDGKGEEWKEAVGGSEKKWYQCLASGMSVNAGFGIDICSSNRLGVLWEGIAGDRTCATVVSPIEEVHCDNGLRQKVTDAHVHCRIVDPCRSSVPEKSRNNQKVSVQKKMASIENANTKDTFNSKSSADEAVCKRKNKVKIEKAPKSVNKERSELIESDVKTNQGLDHSGSKEIIEGITVSNDMLETASSEQTSSKSSGEKVGVGSSRSYVHQEKRRVKQSFTAPPPRGSASSNRSGDKAGQTAELVEANVKTKESIEERQAVSSSFPLIAASASTGCNTDNGRSRSQSNVIEGKTKETTNVEFETKKDPSMNVSLTKKKKGLIVINAESRTCPQVESVQSSCANPSLEIEKTNENPDKNVESIAGDSTAGKLKQSIPDSFLNENGSSSKPPRHLTAKLRQTCNKPSVREKSLLNYAPLELSKISSLVHPATNCHNTSSSELDKRCRSSPIMRAKFSANHNMDPRSIKSILTESLSISSELNIKGVEKNCFSNSFIEEESHNKPSVAAEPKYRCFQSKSLIPSMTSQESGTEVDGTTSDMIHEPTDHIGTSCTSNKNSKDTILDRKNSLCALAYKSKDLFDINSASKQNKDSKGSFTSVINSVTSYRHFRSWFTGSPPPNTIHHGTENKSEEKTNIPYGELSDNVCYLNIHSCSPVSWNQVNLEPKVENSELRIRNIASTHSFKDNVTTYFQSSRDELSNDCPIQGAKKKSMKNSRESDVDTYDDDTYDNGTYDEGTYDEGTYDEGTYDEGTYDEESCDEESCDEGTCDERTYDEESCGEGTFDEGTFDDETFDDDTLDEEFESDDSNEYSSYNSTDHDSSFDYESEFDESQNNKDNSIEGNSEIDSISDSSEPLSRKIIIEEPATMSTVNISESVTIDNNFSVSIEVIDTGVISESAQDQKENSSENKVMTSEQQQNDSDMDKNDNKASASTICIDSRENSVSLSSTKHNSQGKKFSLLKSLFRSGTSEKPHDSEKILIMPKETIREPFTLGRQGKICDMKCSCPVNEKSLVPVKECIPTLNLHGVDSGIHDRKAENGEDYSNEKGMLTESEDTSISLVKTELSTTNIADVEPSTSFHEQKENITILEPENHQGHCHNFEVSISCRLSSLSIENAESKGTKTTETQHMAATRESQHPIIGETVLALSEIESRQDLSTFQAASDLCHRESTEVNQKGASVSTDSMKENSKLNSDNDEEVLLPESTSMSKGSSPLLAAMGHSHLNVQSEKHNGAVSCIQDIGRGHHRRKSKAGYQYISAWDVTHVSKSSM